MKLLLISLFASMVAPSHATFRLARLLRGPCFYFDFEDLSCQCERDGIFGYTATCSGESLPGFFTNIVSSGDGETATAIDCLYDGVDTTGFEVYCTTFNFERNGFLRRLFFGPFYGKGTCTRPTCDKCEMFEGQDRWPELGGGCPIDYNFTRALEEDEM